MRKTKLESLVDMYKDEKKIDNNVVISMIRNDLVRDSSSVGNNVKPEDVSVVKVFNDNLNYTPSKNGVNLFDAESLFRYELGFKVKGNDERFFVPMPIYIAACHKGFDIDSISDVLREITIEPRKRQFIRALMTNENITDRNLKLWLMLQ
jgi:hypothetical protein